ncbi:MAG: UTP--glucose-1-phosphate uridylyltransferase, partial [bacterium]
MRRDGLPPAVIRNFERLFNDVLAGKTGVITEAEIEPLGEIDCFSKVTACNTTTEEGTRLLSKLAVVRLNGGLGTTMGLERAKSLLCVRDNLTFNDIIAHQLDELGKITGVAIPLVHMTSFSTDSDVQQAMKPYGDLSPAGLPQSFLQHRHPKIYID